MAETGLPAPPEPPPRSSNDGESNIQRTSLAGTKHKITRSPSGVSSKNQRSFPANITARSGIASPKESRKVPKGGNAMDEGEDPPSGKRSGAAKSSSSSGITENPMFGRSSTSSSSLEPEAAQRKEVHYDSGRPLKKHLCSGQRP